jgi:lysophospholipid acyltransferase (LPLAT)-like uncharacterized protein
MKLVRPWTIGPFALILSGVVRVWLGTTRIRMTFDEPAADPRCSSSARGIYLFWHEMMLFPCSDRGLPPFSVLVSRHHDGELIARIIQRLGFSVVRGSTTRQGLSALRGLIRQGELSHLAVTPDGPKGPRRVVQQGAVYVASRTGMPIYPAGFAFRDCWRAGSWDRMALPKLWTRGIGIVGSPVIVPPELSAEQIEQHRQLLQAEMDSVQKRAEAAVAAEGRWHGSWGSSKEARV